MILLPFYIPNCHIDFWKKKKTLILVKGNFIFVLWTFGILSSHIFLDHMKGGFGSGRRAKRMELSRWESSSYPLWLDTQILSEWCEISCLSLILGFCLLLVSQKSLQIFLSSGVNSVWAFPLLWTFSFISSPSFTRASSFVSPLNHFRLCPSRFILSSSAFFASGFD